MEYDKGPAPAQSAAPIGGLPAHLDGWQRLGLALSLLWLAASLSVYFSWVGTTYAADFPAPAWMTTWNAINPLDVPPFESEKVAGGVCVNIDLVNPRTHTRYDICELSYAFNLLGFLLFVLEPLAVLWVVILACRQVAQQFRK